jgi:hypothetical protein
VFGLGVFYKIDQAHAESIGEGFERLDGHVRFAALDFADMRTVQARFVR